MAETKTCEECGAALPANAPQGLCPHCLLGMALGLSATGSNETRHLAQHPPYKPGTLGLFGEYELLEEIARGGMGVVYKARQRSLNRIVALKVLLFGRFSSDEFIRRFRAEAEVVANLQHPNIVRIHGFGEQDGQHYFSMDYVQGQDLQERARDNPLPPEMAADYLATIAHAIEYAHQHGVVHRDLKPANVLIDSRDRPHVTDFGLAKRLSSTLDLSVAGTVFGTPNFAAPEQLAGKGSAAGPAVDVYSLGAVLYYLLTGRAPFLAETLEETLSLVLNTQPVRPRLLNPKVPADLETICLKCLRREPHARYHSALALAQDLERWLSGKSILARPAGRLWSTADGSLPHSSVRMANRS